MGRLDIPSHVTPNISEEETEIMSESQDGEMRSQKMFSGHAFMATAFENSLQPWLSAEDKTGSINISSLIGPKRPHLSLKDY